MLHFSRKTPRLQIVPLDLENLYHYVNCYAEVQKNLGVRVTMPEQDPETKYVFMEAHYQASKDPENILWYTSWEVVEPISHEIIGGVCFKGPPEDGDVEIGYAIEPEFRGLGYGTEAVGEMIHWAFEQGVKTVYACTEDGNEASQKLLSKLGFAQLESQDSLLAWLKKNS